MHMSAILHDKDIDHKKWSAAIRLVRAGGYYRRLLKERQFDDPELKDAARECQLALRGFKKAQLL